MPSKYRVQSYPTFCSVPHHRVSGLLLLFLLASGLTNQLSFCGLLYKTGNFLDGAMCAFGLCNPEMIGDQPVKRTSIIKLDVQVT